MQKQTRLKFLRNSIKNACKKYFVEIAFQIQFLIGHIA